MKKTVAEIVSLDVGEVRNSVISFNIIEGGVVDGIGHPMYSELTFENGKPAHQNFDTYQLIRASQSPEEIEVFFV